jgi:hypothetical protein
MISPVEALTVAQLAWDPRSWINRRVERIEYLDDRSVRRRISIDFTVPEDDWLHDGPLHLPVGLFVKEPLTNFSFTDERGEPLPMLTAEQNGAITTTVLRELARVPNEQLVDFIVDEYIERLVFAHAADAKTRDDALFKIFQPGTHVGATLYGFLPFRVLAYDMAENFIVYVRVGPEEKGTRRIIKLSFDRGEIAARPRKPLERLGFVPVTDAFEIPAAGLAASYHVEIEPPADMRVAAAMFFGLRDGEIVWRRTADALTPTAHLNLTYLDRGVGRVLIAVRAESAVLIGAALYSFLNAVALAFVLSRLGEFADQRSFDAVVAVLLAVPGAALAYIVRPGEHPIVSTFLRAIRLLALVAAITSFTAAMVLFAGYKEGQLYHWFRVLVPMASLCAAILVGSWLVQSATSIRMRRDAA